MCVLLICLVNMYSLFLWYTKKEKLLLRYFKNFKPKDLNQKSTGWRNEWVLQYINEIKLPDNDTEVYSMHNEEKAVVTGLII